MPPPKPLSTLPIHPPTQCQLGNAPSNNQPTNHLRYICSDQSALGRCWFDKLTLLDDCMSWRHVDTNYWKARPCFACQPSWIRSAAYLATKHLNEVLMSSKAIRGNTISYRHSLQSLGPQRHVLRQEGAAMRGIVLQMVCPVPSKPGITHCQAVTVSALAQKGHCTQALLARSVAV